MNNTSLLLLLIVGLFACNQKEQQNTTQESAPLDRGYDILMTLGHDTESFTQGLVFNGNELLESTGGNGTSWISSIDYTTGQGARKLSLEDRYFGEGITVMDHKIYQLTWHGKTGFVYDVNDYKKLGTFEYGYEGWGVTHDSTSLIISDGTDKIHYLNPESFKEERTLSVTENGKAVTYLNELEYIHGYIFANVWQSADIVKIDPKDGKVVRRYNFDHLVKDNKSANPRADVLNGIAFNPTNNQTYITGKLWPRAYIVRFR